MPTDQERIRFLLHRYSANQASPDEVRELFAWLQQEGDDTALKAGMHDIWQQAADNAASGNVQWDDMLSRILQKTDQGKERRLPLHKPYRRWSAIAATVTVLLTMAAGGWFYFSSRPHPASTVAQAAGRHLKVNATSTQRISLPDGSRVLVRPGSTLEYTDSLPGLAARMVNLSGEAYFEIAKQPDHPFIIHSGRLITTVLGTAFNIKAWPGEKHITVTVAEGRVKVEDDKQLLGVLEPDKQIVYNTETHLGRQEEVAALAATGWIRQDMVFDNTPFSAIAAQLSRRYQVSIRFKNPELGRCPVTASFNGTETLEEVLTVVCLTRNATYTIHNNQVLIAGKGCLEK